MNTRKTGTVGDRPERGRVAVLIIAILAVLVMAGGVQAGKTSTTVLTAERAADALRAAVVYLDETGSEPLDVEVYDPDGQDGLWLVVVTE